MDGHVREVIIHALETEGVEVTLVMGDLYALSKGGVKRTYKIPDLLSDYLWAAIRRKLGLRAVDFSAPMPGAN